ncbi:MAG: hypothetical protein ABI728_03930, partial [Betaproteobacteria bacterium]
MTRLVIRIADRLWRERIVLLLQVGIAEQHARPLVERDKFLIAVLAQLVYHGVELERLVQVVFRDQ